MMPARMAGLAILTADLLFLLLLLVQGPSPLKQVVFWFAFTTGLFLIFVSSRRVKKRLARLVEIMRGREEC